MTHAIAGLQSALLAALAADEPLIALIGPGAVVDAPPRGMGTPYVAIVRHEAVARDGDLAPGLEHRLVLHAWHPDASRKSVLAIVTRVVAVATGVPLSGEGLRVTLAVHQRTETRIEPRTGQARAAVALRFHSEPAE